jgi:hypothetical protein
MGVSYEIDTSRAHVRITGSGKVTMPEMIAAVDRVAEDQRFRSDFGVILDLRLADYTAELNDGNAFVSALRRREQNFQNQFVLLVPNSLHILGSLFCLLAETSGVDRMKCTTDSKQASAWCGLSE